MYLDRSYRPRRRRSRWRFLWLLLVVAIIAIVLYEQKPTWLIPQQAAPTAVPTRAAVAFLADAQDHMSGGNFDEAIDAYRQMIRLEPMNAAPHIHLSKLYLLLEDLTRSYEHALQATELEPNNPAALTALARIQDWRGEYDPAINNALDALETEPEFADAYAVLGEIYTDVGNWDLAQEYLDQALILDEDNITALRNLAVLYERQGDYEEAVNVFNQAIAAAPDRFDLYIERGRQYRVGLFEYELANESYRQAVEAYEAAITLDALGFGLYNVGDHLQAVRVLRQAVELDPDYGPAQVHLGMALYARRNYEDAVIALEKGIAQLGESARIEHIYTLGLGHIYKNPTECDKALQWLYLALEIDPESGPALEGIALCNE